MAPPKLDITERQVLGSCYAMLALATVFVVARVVTTRLVLVRPKRWLPQDLLIYLAYFTFIALNVLYIVITPMVYRITALGDEESGAIEPYPTLEADLMLITRIFFCNTLLFWIVLWAIKMAFLVLYRNLVDGLQHQTYVKLWWALVIIWALSFVGNVTTHLLSCSSLHAWFTPGECQTVRDDNTQMVSLYFSYSMDVLTDLMIMALPICIIWNLRLPLLQKMSVVGLFCIGVVLVIVATLRVVQIEGKTRSSSTSWLALWAVIECGIAVITGCCPAFVALMHNHAPPTTPYNTQGFVRQRDVENRGGPTPRDIHMDIIIKSSNGEISRGSGDAAWEEADRSCSDAVSGPKLPDVIKELKDETPLRRK